MERAYDTVVEFGDRLLRTQDLDPVYVALTNTQMPRKQLAAVCVAYWCFYHLGASARIAEAKDFWGAMTTAALNTSNSDGSKPWPRGAERRHFRGQQAIDAVTALKRRYRTAEDALQGLLGEVPTYTAVATSAQSHVGFGPWIAFKIADFSERVLGMGTDFSDCELGIYKDPRQGAALLRWERLGDGLIDKPWAAPINDEELKAEVAYWVTFWRKKRAKAPPHRDRLVNVQEIETIFCKYKSHRKGHYPAGKDTQELNHGLVGWGDLAQQLKRGLPSGT
jgi:Alpha-glutamyl/putrescinyl thymine pyrophosphorylase clade 2